jgi:hypothetical protein
MSKSSIFLTATFLTIIGLFSFSIYSGIIEIKKPQNLLGLVGGGSDDFKFVGSVNLENSSSTQNNDYFLNDNNQKETSAPVKVKKGKEPVRTIVKVISGAAVEPNNSITSSSAAATAVAPMVSSTPQLVLPATIATSSNENIALIQNQEETQKQNSATTQEQNLTSTPQIVQESASEQTPAQNNILLVQENISANILISEIMAGADGNSSYEFIELFNPTENPINLTSWSIKKKSSSGSESTLVSASRLEGKIIPANKYFLLANEGGYDGQVSADVFWPKSYTLAYTNNAVVIYNGNGELVEEVSWTEIPKDQSIERESFSANQFKNQFNPNPQNSGSN